MKEIKKIIYAVFLLSVLWVYVDSQYYYFSGPINSDGYQQGCSKELEIRFDTKTGKASAGIFWLKLDDTKINYVTGGSLDSDLFVGNPLGFSDPVYMGRHHDSGYDPYTVLNIQRRNDFGVESTGDRPFGVVKFVPKYHVTGYTVDFGMVYISGSNWTTETTLSFEGADIINPSQQALRLTGTIEVEQKPCTLDTVAPIVSDKNYVNGSTRNINSGLNVELTDSNGTEVPYVWRNGAWTGNIWGINNQYGVDTSTINVNVSGNGYSVTLYSNNFHINPLGTGKTWQDLDRDYKITLSSGELFDFGIEKLITIKYIVEDRAGNKANAIHLFNQPKNPWVSEVSPSNNQSDVASNSVIRFNVHDDRAGVDSGTINLVLSGRGNTFYANYSYLDFELTPIGGSANFDDYNVVLQSHAPFPSSGIIAMSVSGYDLAGNGGLLYSGQFFTKASCEDFGCSSTNMVKISTGNLLNFINYYHNVLYISGGVNPSLIRDGGNTGYINCNLQNNFLSIYGGGVGGTGWEFRGKSAFDELQIIGDDVIATLSGDVLTLERINVYTPPPITTDNIDGERIKTDFLVELIAEATSGQGVANTYYCTGIDTSCTPYIIGTPPVTTFTVTCPNNTTCPSQYVRYYSVDTAGNEELPNTSLPIKIDKQGPEFIFNNDLGEECLDGTLTITSVSDGNGVGLHNTPYSFNGTTWSTTTSIIINAQQP
ncbi:MAG TPA: hypothetical protein PLW94_01960, partial [Candidatus Absconditabacterales bacterium]|nr:hypothetical protein [Candidatus Absconditabacterales bacterium]